MLFTKSERKRNAVFTLDIIQVLSVALRNAGYGEKVLGVYRAFDVDFAEQLSPKQYNDVGATLLWLCKTKLLDGNNGGETAKERLLRSIFEGERSRRHIK